MPSIRVYFISNPITKKMKTKFFPTFLKVLAVGILLSGCAASVNTQAQVVSPADDGSITYQTFYDDLSPYGTWIDYPAYGHVWHPSMGVDFRPYATGGHWVYSGEGWAWTSDYSWGWAPFHYGRWIYDEVYGWLWIPGYTWSPAWVTWGYVDNYYCWAPLMPGISVTAAFGSYRPHSVYWNVVDRAHICDHNVATFAQRPTVVNNITNRITIINNYNKTTINNHYYSTGPRVTEVQHYINQPIHTVNIREVNKNNNIINRNTTNNTTVNSNNNNELRVYRPRVQQTAKNTPPPQPREFRRVNSNSIHPVQSINDHLMGQRQEQIDNINRLPRMTAAGTGAPRGGRRNR